MLIESDFQSDSNDREILPAEFSHLPYICMLTDLIKYNGIFPWHWHSALETDYIMEGDIEFRTPEHTMLQFIHAQYGARITLQDIAASANISSRECSRCFRRCINTSPMGYLCSYRVHIASDLLRRTDDSITSISENCGFSSPGYFCKVFRHITGKTPLEYRRTSFLCMIEEENG